MPAFTTNVEFGYWLHSGKVIYGRPNDACKIKYLDWLYKEDTSENPINNLEKLMSKAIDMSTTLYDKSMYEILPLAERKIISKYIIKK